LREPRGCGQAADRERGRAAEEAAAIDSAASVALPAGIFFVEVGLLVFYVRHENSLELGRGVRGKIGLHITEQTTLETRLVV
jgi:hypothetical protein